MASKKVETTPLLSSCPPSPLSWCFRRPFYECYSTNSSRNCRAQGEWCDLHFIGEKEPKGTEKKKKKKLGLCKSPEQSGAEVGQVNINLSNCSSSCRIQLKLRRAENPLGQDAPIGLCHPLLSPSCHKGSLTPMSHQVLPSGLEEALTCLFRGEMGQCRLGFALLMLLQAWGWLLPGWVSCRL